MNQQENVKTDGKASCDVDKPSTVEESAGSEREDKVAAEETGPSKRSRTTFTPAQQAALEQAFLAAPYPDSSAREHISKVTAIAEAKVQIWFQNRRARYRKKDKPRRQQKQRQMVMQMMSQPIVPVYPAFNLFPTHGACAHVVPPCVPFPMLSWRPHLHSYPPPPTSSGL